MMSSQCLTLGFIQDGSAQTLGSSFPCNLTKDIYFSIRQLLLCSPSSVCLLTNRNFWIPVSATFMTPSLVDSNQNVGTVVASNYCNTYLQNNLWFAKRRIHLLHFRQMATYPRFTIFVNSRNMPHNT